MIAPLAVLGANPAIPSARRSRRSRSSSVPVTTRIAMSGAARRSPAIPAKGLRPAL